MGKKIAENRTNKLLRKYTNPLITVSIIQGGTSVGANVGRSMGFVIERLEDDLRLVVMCRHSLTGKQRYDQSFIVGIENPGPTVVQCMGWPIEDPDPRTDVAFMVVRDPLNANTKCFALRAEDPPRIQQAQRLYNVQNQCNPLTRTYGTLVTPQSIRAETTTAYRSVLRGTDTRWVSFEDADARHQFIEAGWIEHRRFNMVSRRGYSGSPIWDEELKLYGMVVAGSEPSDENYATLGDWCICMPTSQLFLARQRINVKLQELLAAIRK